MIESIRKTEECYYKTLNNISVIKNLSVYTPDLTKQQIAKGGGFLLELFFHFRELYQEFGTFIRQQAFNVEQLD